MKSFAGFPRAGVAIGAAVLAVNLPARAAVVELAPSRDNFIMDDITDASCAVGNLFVGDNIGSASRRAFLAFDVAGEIPAGSTINSVELRVNIIASDVGADPANVYKLQRVIANWGESAFPNSSNCFATKGAVAEDGDVTWSHRFWPTTTWATPGGQFLATITASIQMPLVGPATFPTGTRMVSDVQSWLNNPSSNFGWILTGGEGTPHTMREISSREGPSPPNLIVTYTAPLPTTPPEVPDGRLAAPVRVSKLTANGVDLQITWDTAHCTINADHNLVYGTRSTFPAVPGNPYGLQGVVCGPGATSPFSWLGSPNPATLDPTSKLIWMLVVANDGAGVEGSWGRRSNFTERNGPGTNGSSNACGITNKSLANHCGQDTLLRMPLLDASESDATIQDLEAP